MTVGMMISRLQTMVENGDADMDSPLLLVNDEFSSLCEFGGDVIDDTEYFYSDVIPLKYDSESFSNEKTEIEKYIKNKAIVLNALRVTKNFNLQKG